MSSFWFGRFVSLLWCIAAFGAGNAFAEKRYGPGATDSEIKIGQTMPYSGPASAYATTGRAHAAYFAKINAEGGIHGRKIKLISLDDGYSPPKTVEQMRKLVEQEQALFIFSSFGTPPNIAVAKYLNARKVPHLFVASGASQFGDFKSFPWSMGWRANYVTEGQIYAKYVLKNHPNARIAVMYQHDDVGKDYLEGLRRGFGGKTDQMIVATASFEISDPTVDSQIVTLKGSGADVLFIFSTPKAAAQAIRKAYDIGWRPLQFVGNPAASIATVLRPAGLEKSVGIISATFMKDPTDSAWRNDTGLKDWLAFMKEYYPEGDIADPYNVYAYCLAQTIVHVLKQAGDDLTRENVMRQAQSLNSFELPMLLPGIKIDTGPSDYQPIEQMQLQRFDGTHWVLFGDVLDVNAFHT
jgi:branched-chain amino acid transport system substrate-binding protein